MSADPAGRAMCYRCFKPVPVCICASVRPVHNRTGVLILQHPRERHHPIGTARFARLGLLNSRVQICGPKDSEGLRRAQHLPDNAALLYPHPDARDVATLPANERPEHLILLDGTWNHAERIYRASPWLQELPHLRIAPEQPSQYRIRREPRAECLSTIEALVLALRCLEPQTEGLDDLLVAFAEMIDQQIAHAARSSGAARFVHRAARPPSMPRLLIDDPARLVVAYSEVVNQPTPTPTGKPQRELVYWTAYRPHTEEIFARFIAPSRITDDIRGHLDHMGLGALIDQGTSRATLDRDWLSFTRPDDIIVAWNKSTLDQTPSRHGTRLLKGIYCNLIKGACGHLTDVLEREHLVVTPLPITGRAAVRLGNATAILRYLQQRARALQL